MRGPISDERHAKLRQICFKVTLLLPSENCYVPIRYSAQLSSSRLTLIDDEAAAAAAAADVEVLSTDSLSMYANMRCDGDGGTAAATAATDCSGTRISIILPTSLYLLACKIFSFRIVASESRLAASSVARLLSAHTGQPAATLLLLLLTDAALLLMTSHCRQLHRHSVDSEAFRLP